MEPRPLRQTGASTKQLPILTRGCSPISETAGAPLCGGIIDRLAELAVSGATETRDALGTLGGTLICWVISEHCGETPGLWTVPHIKDSRCLTGEATSAGSILLDQVRVQLDGENARATKYGGRTVVEQRRRQRPSRLGAFSTPRTHHSRRERQEEATS